MKLPYTLSSIAFVAMVASASGQNFPSSSTFFGPVAEASARGDNQFLLNIRYNNTLNTAPQTAPGTVRWTHAAGGHLQVGLQTGSVLSLDLADLDAQLFASSRTTGTSLVFGRNTLLKATLVAGLIDISGTSGAALNTLLNTLVSPDIGYRWDSTALVSGLDLQQGQTYRVSFQVASAAGVPVDAIAAASFGISSGGITTVGATTGTFINLLDVISIGSAADSDTVTYDFVANSNLNSLSLNFQAQSLVGANLLNSNANDYLTISGISVSPIPEPTAAALAFAGLGAAALRRRRRD